MFESGYFLTIPQVIGAARRRWIPASILAMLIVVAATGAIFSIRDQYESVGSIYLKAGRATLTVDPTASTSQTSSLLDTRQAEIQSIKEMLAARHLVEDVAEKVGIDRIMDQRSELSKWIEQLGEFKESILGKKKIETLSEEEVAAIERLESSVTYIQKQMKIKASKDGNTVSISCRAHTPFLAQDIVAAMMEKFNEQYLLVHKSKGSLSFFEEELTKSNDILMSREKSLRDLKDELQVMTVEDQRSLIQQELAAIQAERIASESSLVAVDAEILHLEQQMSEQPEFINAETTDKASYASDLMRQGLYALEVSESELKAKYTDKHPQVVQARDKIEKSRAIFDKQGGRFDESKKMVNPIRQDVEKNLILASGKHESLTAKLSGLKAEYVSVQSKMRGLNSAEVRITEMNRLVEQARDDYRNIARKLEEARILDELDQSMNSDIKVFQPASLVLEKVFPQRVLMLGVVLFGSFFVGLAFAIWRDQSSNYSMIAQRNGVPFVVGGRSKEIGQKSAPLSDSTQISFGRPIARGSEIGEGVVHQEV